MQLVNFETGANVTGTSYQGEIKATRDELELIFGEPENGRDDKTRWEWALDLEVNIGVDGDNDFLTASIYDWKGSADSDVWHIGGKSPEAAWMISDVVEEIRRQTI